MESTDRSDANAINRREAVRRVGLLLGGALSAPAVAGALSGCQPSASDDWTPTAFSPEQDEMVASMAEHILPATDTPGARDVQVNRFIDTMMAEWYGPDDRQSFLDGLGQVNARCRQQRGQPYLQCSEEHQFALLQRLDQRAFTSGREQEGEVQTGDPEAAESDAGEAKKGGATRTEEAIADAQAQDTTRASTPPRATVDDAFFRRLKELTLLGYYTSEAGMKQELQVNIVPGRYDPCAPLDEVRTNLA